MKAFRITEYLRQIALDGKQRVPSSGVRVDLSVCQRMGKVPTLRRLMIGLLSKVGTYGAFATRTSNCLPNSDGRNRSSTKDD